MDRLPALLGRETIVSSLLDPQRAEGPPANALSADGVAACRVPGASDASGV